MVLLLVAHIDGLRVKLVWELVLFGGGVVVVRLMGL